MSLSRPEAEQDQNLSVQALWMSLLVLTDKYCPLFRHSQVCLKCLISFALKSCLKTFTRTSPWVSYFCQASTYHKKVRAVSVVLCCLTGFLEVFCVAIVINTWIIYFITFQTVWERNQEGVFWFKRSMRRHVSSFYLSQRSGIYLRLSFLQIKSLPCVNVV